MTFNPNIPGANDLISQSQSEIQTNFAQSNTIFDIDHVTFDDATSADRGKHRKSTYIEVADPTTVANEMAMYAKAVSGATRLFLRQENNGTIFQFSGPDPTAAATGQTFLPGGIILKWGTTSANGTTAITFAGLGLSNFPNNCWQVMVNPVTTTGPTVANDYVYAYSPTTTGFTANGVRRITLQASAVNFVFLAIGN